MMMKRYLYLLTIVLLFSLFVDGYAVAQDFYGGRGRGRGRGWDEPPGNSVRDIFPSDCFTFCRIQYDSYGGRGWGRGGGRWSTDYPDAEDNFSMRLSELTTIEVNKNEQGEYQHTYLRLTDDDLFNYPFIYMLEVGNLHFSDEEAKRLGEYLLRGGFLLVDDFWGTSDLQNWEVEFSRALPPDEYPMKDIPLDHEIFRIVFQLDEKPQIPGIGYWYGSGGDTSEARRFGDPNPEVHIKGVWDKQGRLMAVINHNSDLGDGWEEEAKNPQYFEEVSKRKAYPFGINIIVYALTH
jgi:hypothetical protein